MRLLLVFAILAACKTARPSPPRSELDELATRFAAAMSPCNPTTIDTLVDSDALITRMIAGRNFTSSQIDRLRRSARGHIGAIVCARLPSDSFTYLRTQTIDRTPRPLFRMLTRGLNYVELELATTGGAVRIVDFYNVGDGENLSQLLGDAASRVVAGGETPSTVAVRVRQRVSERQGAEARVLLATLPADVRRTKTMMLMAIKIAELLDDEPAYLAAVDAYAKQYPGDPSLELVQLDHSILRKDPHAFTLIDRLDKRLGGDPYQDIMRAAAAREAGNHAAAVTYAKRATEREPGLEVAWWALAAAHAGAGNINAALATFGHLRAQFRATFGGLRDDARFIALTATAEYAAWAAEHL
ncbi:MAG: BTAD domain-containing putative transcriptional regulator [Kofleriaceae bacterium]